MGHNRRLLLFILLYSKEEMEKAPPRDELSPVDDKTKREVETMLQKGHEGVCVRCLQYMQKKQQSLLNSRGYSTAI